MIIRNHFLTYHWAGQLDTVLRAEVAFDQVAGSSVQLSFATGNLYSAETNTASEPRPFLDRD